MLTSRLKTFLFFIIACFSWAIWWWLYSSHCYYPFALGDKNVFLWIIQNYKFLALKCGISFFVGSVIIVLPALLKKRPIDISPFKPSLILLAAPLQLIPPANRLLGFPLFLFQDLGPLIPLTTAFAIFFLKFRKQLIKIGNNITARIETATIPRLSLTLFIVSVLIYVFFSLLLIHPYATQQEKNYLMTGDEPQYLLITHSLVFDRDFNLHNNIANSDSLNFCGSVLGGFSDCTEQYSKWGKEYWKDRSYSNLNLGLPILIAPFYALGTLWDNQIRLCVIIFINLLASLFIVNIFLLCCDFVKNKSASLFITTFLSLSMPIVFYSRNVFPDLPAALILLYGFRKIYEKSFHCFYQIFFIALCISYLPWIHTKYVITSFLLLGYFIWQWRKENYKLWPLLFLLFPLILSAFFQAKYYYALYGVPYPINAHPNFSLSRLFSGASGLLFDEAHGIIPYAPIYIISLVGIIIFVQDRKSVDQNKMSNIFWLLLFPTTFFLGTACFKEWWAGLCPAGRYLLPVVPFLTPFIAYAYSRINIGFFRGSVIILGFLSAAIGIEGMLFPGRLYRHMHPFISYATSMNISGIFPSMFNPSVQQYKSVFAWTVSIAVFAAYFAANTSRKTPFKNNLLIICSVPFFSLFLLSLTGTIIPAPIDRSEKLNIYNKLFNSKDHALFYSDEKYNLIKNTNFLLPSLTICYEAEELLSPEDNKISDNAAGNKIAVAGKAGIASEGYILYGPYVNFPKGIYKIAFNLKTNNNTTSSTVAVLDVVSHKGKKEHGKLNILGTDFKTSGEYEDFTFTFTIKHAASDIEFRLYYTAKADVYLDKFIVEPMEG